MLENDAAEIGTFLQPGGICATVIDLDPIKLVGFVAERDMARLEIGAPAGGRLVSGTEVRGEVTFLSRSADEQTRTFRVEVTVPNKDRAISDGTTAEIFIAFAGDKAHFLPQSALTLNDDGALGIRAAVDDVARFFPVEIVRDTAKGIWVAGLPETIDVITVGQEYVVDGRAIETTLVEASE